MTLFSFTENDYYLSLDRTNWKWGKTNINLLVLAVVYRGTAIPVYWLPLNKRGNSNTRERMALMKRFINRFGRRRIKGLLADREFIGDAWVGWLIEQKIPFYIRIRNNSLSENSRGESMSVSHLFRALQPGEILNIPDPRCLGSCSVYLSGLRLADGELLILISHHLDREAVKVYGLRWENLHAHTFAEHAPAEIFFGLVDIATVRSEHRPHETLVPTFKTSTDVGRRRARSSAMAKVWRVMVRCSSAAPSSPKAGMSRVLVLPGSE